MTSPIVKTTELRVDYRDAGRALRVLNGIDLEIKRGSIVAVLGPSGCGKTTFLRALAGLVPTKPEMLSTSFCSTSDIGPINMAFQNPVLLPWLTVEKNALLPYRIHHAEITPEVSHRLNRLLYSVQMFGRRDALPRTLSGGMQMRAAMVRSFLNQPELLLMDEPFAALDEVTRQDLNDKLLGLWNDEACTILLVTHNIQEAVYLADRVLVFSKRPARIILDRRVEFARPRTPRLREKPAFHAFVRDLHRWIGHD